MNIFRSMLYVARRFKIETILNFLGLTVAFSTFYLMMTQVDFNLSYNHEIPDSERVLRLEMMSGIHSNRVITSVVSQMPQVEGVTEVADFVFTEKFRVGERAIESPAMLTGLTPFGAVGTQCLDGQLYWDDYGEPTVMLPASLARKLFDGQTAVAGKPLLYGKDTLWVKGVYEDFPANCSMRNAVYAAMPQGIGDWSACDIVCYLKLRPTVDVAAFQHDFPSLLKAPLEACLAKSFPDVLEDVDTVGKHSRVEKWISDYKILVRPIHDTWFSGVHPGDKGNRPMLSILLLACLFVILVPTANFLNFTLAESPLRIRSVTVRRVLGEGLFRLRASLMAETILISLVACVLALVVCDQSSRQLAHLLLGDISPVSHVGLLVMMAFISVLVGVLAGAYPSFFATSFEPAVALKGSFGFTPKGRRLRASLVGIQLSIAMFIFIFNGVLSSQSYYIYHSDYGFNKDQVLCADLPDAMMDKKAALRDSLLGIDGVVDVSYSRFMLGTSEEYVEWKISDEKQGVNMSFTCLYVDQRYLQTLGIPIVEGRDFSMADSDCYIINEAARQEWPWVQMGQPLKDGDLPVVGVCKNLRFATTRQDCMHQPMAFVILGERYSGWGDQLSTINVRIAHDADQLLVRQRIQDRLNAMSDGTEVALKYLDQCLEQVYEENFRFIRQVQGLSLVCLIVTLVGVFCLTMFETSYRRREIGIRKVMGATVSQIHLLLCRQYIRLLAVSFVVAAPFAWYFGTLWLSTFAEHEAIHWWLFPLSAFVVSFVTLTTVVIQSWRAARANPVESIQSE